MAALAMQMFPLHILATMAAMSAGAAQPRQEPGMHQQLARSHHDVTLLFME